MLPSFLCSSLAALGLLLACCTISFSDDPFEKDPFDNDFFKKSSFDEDEFFKRDDSLDNSFFQKTVVCPCDSETAIGKCEDGFMKCTNRDRKECCSSGCCTMTKKQGEEVSKHAKLMLGLTLGPFIAVVIAIIFGSCCLCCCVGGGVYFLIAKSRNRRGQLPPPGPPPPGQPPPGGYY